MKRPAFQFYVADWRTNSKLRRCSWAARGAWIDVMGLMHDSDEYGVLRWPLKEIQSASGAPMALLRELIDKGVLKGADKGAADYMHTPTHAGKKGEPVRLVEAKDGPCWYCSRFVRDEWIRSRQGGATKFTSENNPNRPPEPPPTGSPTRPFGEGLGDGAAFASASSRSKAKAGDDACPHSDILALYHELLPANPRIKTWTEQRQANLRTRWREDIKRQSLPYWRRFFTHVAASPFLTGRTPGTNGRPFLPGLDWLVKPENFAKVIEGRYHDGAAA